MLIEAAIQLGEGNLANAVTSINAVRANVGNVPAYSGAVTYVAVRDQLLHELRASNIGEPGEERMMAVRNYGLQASRRPRGARPTSTPRSLPIPIQESGPRNGNITPSLPVTGCCSTGHGNRTGTSGLETKRPPAICRGPFSHLLTPALVAAQSGMAPGST